jgi:hypothetical protein
LSEPTLPEKILAIHRLLSREKVPHAFGGALALAYYAEPRATIDIDVNIFLSPADYPALERTLATLGVHDGADPDAVMRDGQCRLRWGSSPIDLFFAYDPLHDAMKAAVRKQPFAEDFIPVLAPEHLLVCKVVFNRPKDWLDVEQMIVASERLDLDEAKEWLSRILGSGDPRLERLEALRQAGTD